MKRFFTRPDSAHASPRCFRWARSAQRVPFVPSALVKTAGFTLIEVLVVTVLLGILLAIALPNLADMIVSSRLTSQSNDLVADLILARSEAASRGVNVTVCPSSDSATCASANADWKAGRIVYVDADFNDSRSNNEPLVRARPALSEDSSLLAAGFTNVVSVAFNPYGGLRSLSNGGSFKLCSSTSTTGRQISVDFSGRPSISRVSCP